MNQSYYYEARLPSGSSEQGSTTTSTLRGPTLGTGLLAMAKAGILPKNTPLKISPEGEWITTIAEVEEAASIPPKRSETNPDTLQSSRAHPTSSSSSSSNEATSNKRGRPTLRTSSVYVTGLPTTGATTAEDVSRLFSKLAGLIKRDYRTQEEKVKLYRDSETSELKGDALITFMKPESVDLAVDLLDGTEFEPGSGVRMTVKPAEFGELPSETSGKRSKSSEKDEEQLSSFEKAEQERIRRVRKRQEQLALSWADDTTGPVDASLQIVVLRNMFDSQTLRESGDAGLRELESDILEGLSVISGEPEIVKITVFTKHPEGVVLVRFADPVHAEECVRLMRNRWFDGRRIAAEHWDGVTMFGSDDADERTEDEKKRLESFSEWLESKEDEDEL